MKIFSFLQNEEIFPSIYNLHNHSFFSVLPLTEEKESQTNEDELFQLRDRDNQGDELIYNIFKLFMIRFDNQLIDNQTHPRHFVVIF